MSIKELCDDLCKDISFLRNLLKAQDISITSNQEELLNRMQDMLVNGMDDYPEAVIERRLVSLMLIVEVLRDADTANIHVVLIMNAECLQLIKYFRDKEAGQTFEWEEQ